MKKTLQILLIVACLSNLCTSLETTIQATVNEKAISSFLLNQVFPLFEQSLPCFEMPVIKDHVDETILTADIAISQLRISQLALNPSQYDLNFFSGTSPADVAQKVCEATENSDCIQSGNAFYKSCPPDFQISDGECKPFCPSGFTDNLLYCLKPSAYGRGVGYPWKFGDGFNLNGARARCLAQHPAGCEQNGLIIYPDCAPNFHNVACCICSPDCPSGWTDIGISCKKPDTQSRKAYNIGQYNNEIQLSLGLANLGIVGDISLAVDGVTDVQNGHLSASVSGSSVFLRVGAALDVNNLIQVDIAQSELNIGSLDVSLSGTFGADILDVLLQIVKGLVQNEIESTISNLNSLVGPQINLALTNVPEQFTFMSLIQFGFSFTEEPVFNPQYLQVGLNTHIDIASMVKNAVYADAPDPQVVPSIKTLGEPNSVSLLVNPDFINQPLVSLFNAGFLQYNKTGLNFSSFGISVAGAYTYATDYAPFFNVLMEVTGDTNFSYSSMTAQVLVTLNTTKYPNGTLVAQIASINISDIGGTIAQRLNQTTQIFTWLVNGVAANFLPQINGMIPQLVIPSFDGVTITNFDVTFDDATGGIIIVATPEFDTLVLDQKMSDSLTLTLGAAGFTDICKS